ncbi:M23 family metallopeptidase [Candidatus Symbiobacter mobilis]|uniref:peptidoglycan DD-metalloendopeptidase family protein n=1 Tax=Candidatus Symbiobacter mobilis TaxID=1436290 RepID=UPI0009DB9C9E
MSPYSLRTAPTPPLFSSLLSSLLSSLFTRPTRQVLSLLAAVWLTGAGAALAVVSLAPDAADLPVRDVLESVANLTQIGSNADEEAGAAEPAPLLLYRSDTTRHNDTADTLLRRMGVDDPAAAAFLRNDPTARQILGRSGKFVSTESLPNRQMHRLVARWAAEEPSLDKPSPFLRLVVERTDSGFRSLLESATLERSTRLASATIRSSLFAAADAASVPDSIALELAEIFSGDIDFHRALRKGDRFSVVYETLEADGEVLRTGKVLAAEFVNRGKTYRAMWFAGSQGTGAYFTPEGLSLRKPFLASPVAFSRITSGFSMRLHPILGTMRHHRGIDYAAPTGTPIRSVGDGVVTFTGRQGGYGNVVFVQHDAKNSTVYGHLSRIDVRKGQTITQGQRIGAVGSTGWATGPHLHFEFRVSGVHIDPLTIARQAASPSLPTAMRPSFERIATQMRQHLAAARQIEPTSMQ